MLTQHIIAFQSIVDIKNFEKFVTFCLTISDKIHFFKSEDMGMYRFITSIAQTAKFIFMTCI